MTDSLSRLDDYLRKQLPDAEVEGYEEELFARAMVGEAPELNFRRDLIAAFREMRSNGTIDLWLTRAQADRFLKSERVLLYDLTPDHPPTPDFSVDFDILVTKVHLDLTGLKQVDVEVLTPDGALLKVMPEIAFDPAEGAIYSCCEADLARAADSVNTTTRIWGTEHSGQRRVLTTIHTAAGQ